MTIFKELFCLIFTNLICKYLKERNVYINNLTLADVVIVDKAINIRKALDTVDFALMNGKEILCFKNECKKEYYVCNYLIKEGAIQQHSDL